VHIRFAVRIVVMMAIAILASLIGTQSGITSDSTQTSDQAIVNIDTVVLTAAASYSSKLGSTSTAEARQCDAGDFYRTDFAFRGTAGKERWDIAHVNISIRNTQANPDDNRICAYAKFGGTARNKNIPLNINVGSESCDGGERRWISWEHDPTVNLMTYGRAGTPGDDRCGVVKAWTTYKGKYFGITVTRRMFGRLFQN
jgi:hypothetical protein